MSCHNSTYDAALVELEPSSSATLDGYGRATEKCFEVGKSPKQQRSRLSADPSEQYRRNGHSHIIPDSTQTDPEYVWGDEGPILTKQIGTTTHLNPAKIEGA